MTAAQFERLAPSEAEALLCARFRALAACGCPPDDALVLASRVDVDVCDAIQGKERMAAQTWPEAIVPTGEQRLWQAIGM